MAAMLTTDGSVPAPPVPPITPLVLADRLLTLAQDADRAGFQHTAGRLVMLACTLWDNNED